MVIALLAGAPGPHEKLEPLADGLRSAGHVVRVLSLDADLSGASADAVLTNGLCPPAVLTGLMDTGVNLCVIALLQPGELEGWQPQDAYTDFVVAPFRVAEVMARLALHQHRHRGEAIEVIRSGSLVIDVTNYTVRAAEERIALTFKEFELLRFLVTHPGRVFTRDALLEHVWGFDYWGGSRTIDVHIRRIRSKLTPDTANRIETVHQVGYRYAAPRD